jgi:hypothetical protein
MEEQGTRRNRRLFPSTEAMRPMCVSQGPLQLPEQTQEVILHTKGREKART